MTPNMTPAVAEGAATLVAAPTIPLLALYRVSLAEEPGDKFQIQFDCLALDDADADDQALKQYVYGVVRHTTLSPDGPDEDSPHLRPYRFTVAPKKCGEPTEFDIRAESDEQAVALVTEYRPDFSIVSCLPAPPPGEQAAEAPSRVDTYEGMCFVSTADTDWLSDEQLAAVNLKFKDQFPPGVLAILLLTAGADSDDVDEADEGGEQKVFVRVELQVTPAISGIDPSDSGVLALLDSLAFELREEFVVEREEWSLDNSEAFEPCEQGGASWPRLTGLISRRPTTCWTGTTT